MILDRYGGECRYEVYGLETIAPGKYGRRKVHGQRVALLDTCTAEGQIRLPAWCRLKW